MTSHYRLDIRKDGALWGTLHLEHPNAELALADFTRLLDAHGLSHQVMQAVGERRLLESTPQGVNLLFREAVYQPLKA